MATRSIIGKDSIPTGTLGTGTVNADGNTVNGMGNTAFLTDLADAANKAYWYWIYFVTSHKIARVEAVYTNFHLKIDRSLSLPPQTYKIVQGELRAFSIENIGGSNGTWQEGDNGSAEVTLPNGSAATERRMADNNRDSAYKNVALVNATGTEYIVSETK